MYSGYSNVKSLLRKSKEVQKGVSEEEGEGWVMPTLQKVFHTAHGTVRCRLVSTLDVANCVHT